MRITLIFAWLIVATGCSSAPICGFDLSDEGWTAAVDIPNLIREDYEYPDDRQFTTLWYRNKEGEYMACRTHLSPKSDGCPFSSIVFYRLLPSGRFDFRNAGPEIICTS